MMGLFSTIRGKKDAPVIGSVDVAPIPAKSKRMVINEWPRIMEHQPDLFKIVWTKSARRSTSIKKAFGMDEHEDPQQNKAFMALPSTIQAFFYQLIVTLELDDDKLVQTCEQLGRRHVDFIARGFNSTFWDIFLVCMAEAIDTTLSGYFSDSARKEEMIQSCQRPVVLLTKSEHEYRDEEVLETSTAALRERVINMIVHHMRSGYIGRRKEQLQTKNGI